MRSEIGYCVTILSHKLWGRILVNGRLRSQNWWRQKLESEINSPTIVISAENLWECRTAEPAPIPFEQEMGWAGGYSRVLVRVVTKGICRLTFYKFVVKSIP